MLNRILKLVESRRFEWIEGKIEEPEKDNEVLLKMVYCGICGSDISVYKGEHPYASYPRVLGHEICGEIIKHNKPTGRFITISPYKNCGICSSCFSGDYYRCIDNQTMGVQRDGAFQDYIIVKKDGYNQYLLEHTDTMASLPTKLQAIIEPFFVGRSAAGKIKNLNKNKSILIIGDGPIGIYTGINIQEMFSSNNIYIAGNGNKKRLQVAKEIGLKTIGYLSEYDIVIEASGSNDGIEQSLLQAKSGGTIILVGHNPSVKLNHSLIIKKELTVVGSRNTNYFANNMGYHSSIIIKNNDKLNKTITDIIDFKDAPKYFKDIENGKNDFVKTLVKF